MLIASAVVLMMMVHKGENWSFNPQSVRSHKANESLSDFSHLIVVHTIVQMSGDDNQFDALK